MIETNPPYIKMPPHQRSDTDTYPEVLLIFSCFVSPVFFFSYFWRCLTNSSSTSSSDSDTKAKRHGKRKRGKHKDKKKKIKKKLKKSKERVKEDRGVSEALPGPSLELWQKEPQVDPGPVLTDEQKSRIQAMKPMTKEEWDVRQSVIRRVVDPETGRTRLIKGDGEVLEEIISKERHKEINKQEHNVRMYIEEQDDQDGSTWKCIVRNRNELAETLELLKAQIDPALLKNNSQQENSSRESPSIEDEDTKKGEEASTQENQLKIKEEKDEVEEQSKELESLPLPVVKEDENMMKIEKAEEKEIIKLPVRVKLEKPSEYNEEKQTVQEESDSFKENVKPVKAEVKENKIEPKDLKEVKSSTDKIAVHEPERLEFCVNSGE
ncbi:putative pre-mRNA-splicing factor ATP-dependent RNA helicase DHX16 [Lagopus muta]|uniref:putative pre-mRNA-splicing factor ATP-dependent RNA helicase DHX16 n=1 Tax=Lagopus muta TaxID=64668 RepID=UPI00209FB3AD|nr:putative pre-mRNA-splicing factor ATP-dependent RNA helicase DHX16 [Lagopus muta]